MTSLAVMTSLQVSYSSYDDSFLAFSFSRLSMSSKSKLLSKSMSKLMSKWLSMSKLLLMKPLWLYFYFLTFLILVILFYGNSYDAHRHLYISSVSDDRSSGRLLTSNLHYLHDFHQLYLHRLEIER